MVDKREKDIESTMQEIADWCDRSGLAFGQSAELGKLIDRAVSISRASPIDMVLFCPACGRQHIDEVEVVLARTGGAVPEPSHNEVTWDSPPHRSHLCGACGCIWRPADVATNGVKSVQTKGKADTFDPARCRYACANFPHCGCEVEALSPPATPQAPEDMISAASDIARSMTYDRALANQIISALADAHLLATPDAVTMEEISLLVTHYEGRAGESLVLSMAEALRRVVGDRIRIAGEPS